MLTYNKDIDSDSQSNSIFLFTGPTCGQCKMIKPRIEKLASVRQDYNFYEVDTSTEEGIELAMKYKVAMLPTAVVMSKEEPVVFRGAGQVVNLEKSLND